MKCFIHMHEEALAVCNRCGKAMCASCSAYSGHKGICPECRRNEFIAERKERQKKVRSHLSNMIGYTIAAILFILFMTNLVSLEESTGTVELTVLVLGICLFAFLKHFFNRKKELKRIETLTSEIDRLALSLENKGNQFM